MTARRWLRRLARPLAAKMTREPLERFLARHAASGRTLDIGASTSPYSHLFPHRIALDVRNAPGVQVIGDAQRLGIRSSCMDTVLCTEVLEHLPDPQRGLDEMLRVLKPGGRLLLTTRFIFPLHDTPHDYFRFTKYGLGHLLRRFEIVELVEEADTFHTLAILVQRLAFQADTLRWRPLHVIWLVAARLVAPLSFLLTAEYGDSHRSRTERPMMTSGYHVACRKPR
jgi:SAM-dependent methyltransferase